MPTDRRPATGRGKDFDPRRGQGPSFQDRKRRGADAAPARGAGKPGSKSPNHRGYRAEPEAPAAKRRWTAQERAGRDESRGIRRDAQRGDRPASSGPIGERVPRDDRRTFGDARPSYRDGRPAQGGDRPRRDDRSARSFDRPARSFEDRPRRDDSPARSFDDRPRRDDRPARPFDHRPRRDDRPARSFDDRPARSFDDRPRRDDRPARSFDDRPRREDRPARSFGDRPARSFDDRPARSFDDRPRRDDRPARSFDDRPRRDDRPARSFDDRPRREDRPARSFDDRPRREDRPARSFDDRPRRDDRPARSFDDRPRRDDRADRGIRPSRDDWSASTPARDEHLDTVHERLAAEAVDAATVADASFAALGLGQNLVTTLAELGAEHPFPIQAATIPPILEGRDVLARGRTGSGKTIAFGAPLVESVLRSQAGQRREFGRSPRALILAPTRELALQIDRTVQSLARSVGLFTTQIYGGVPQARQVGALRKGVDIVIGTPGRIEDLVRQDKLDLSQVRVVVLDEADHMSELGFLEPMQRILRLVEPGAQKLLFSATLDREVAGLVDEFLTDPAVYEVAGEDQDSGTTEHRVLVIDHRDKPEVLQQLVDRDGKTLVFARTRAFAEMLAEQFDDAGIHAVALHGDLNQAKRTRNLERLTSGRVSVLVATDVAARGIHVDDIDLVVQADPPDEYKTYLHRAGRTGRAGRAGTVVTLVTRQRRRRMQELLDRAEIDAPFVEARPGDDVIAELVGGSTAEPSTD